MSVKRVLLIAACMAALAAWCMWGTGAERLMVTDPQAAQAEAQAPQTRQDDVRWAAIDCLPVQHATPDVPQFLEPYRASDFCEAQRWDIARAGQPVRDANGNVVLAVRYSRAVYCAFALGDMPG